jgi:glycosyltransferase involved in cell wall biosynthesis
VLARLHRRLRILTFSVHEGFNYALAKTGHRFDVLLAPREPWEADWDERSRPLPRNFHIVGTIEDLPDLDLSPYDLLLPQSLAQFEAVEFASLPKLFVVHTDFGYPPEWGSKEAAMAYMNLRRRLEDIPTVFVSEFLREAWALPGKVIGNGVDGRDYAEYPWNGERAAVLTVGHFLEERRDVTGWDLWLEVTRDLPTHVVGINPSLSGVAPAGSWEELRRTYQDYRVYLNTTPGTGRAATLEAAATGMPIVTTPRSDHLFTDGYDAVVSDDPARLRAGLIKLLRDRELARTIGERARETVLRRRGIGRFVDAWRTELAAAARSRRHPYSQAISEQDVERVAAEIEPRNRSLQLAPGEIVREPVFVRNVGARSWPSYTRYGRGEVHLAYRLVGAGEGLRTRLPADVGRGEEVQLDAFLRAPTAPGRYTLGWQLTVEAVTWIDGGPTPDVELTVQ